MSEGATGPARKASPWPVFVAVGLAVSEIGVFLDGLYPLAVAGLLLFVGSVAGIVAEAGYVDRPWPLLAGLSVVLVVLGAALFQFGGAIVGWGAAGRGVEGV